MLKKIIYLVLIILTMFTCTAFGAKYEPVQGSWQKIDIGPAENEIYAFDTATIKYARNDDGSINKNIIIYDEKKINNIPVSGEYNYYSITKCKINQELQSICFGKESFYTKKGKFRWSDTPTYMAWITVKPDTVGQMRYSVIVSYAIEHETELEARS